MKCPKCGTPPHLFYNHKCPICDPPSPLPAEWYPLHQIASGGDPREYEICLSAGQIVAAVNFADENILIDAANYTITVIPGRRKP